MAEEALTGDRPLDDQQTGRRRSIIVRFAIASVMALLCPALMTLFARSDGAFFPAYRGFSKALLGLLGMVSGL
ncbi:MAG: hypothetical protein IJH87_04555, partial [Atopobiaceae bacterium]|nr:hypothetical protein [Atopobiaceae bacterium]